MQITKDSHVDHNLTEAQLAFIADKYADRATFFIDTFELPEELGTVPCGIHGPSVGDEPVPEDEVHYAVRSGRKCASRLCRRPQRPSRTVTVVAGPHEGKCILYTAYGGPCAPREPGDFSLQTMEEVVEAREFWAKHALSAR